MTGHQPNRDASDDALLIQFNWAVVVFGLSYMLVSWIIGFQPGVYVMATHSLILLANLAYFYRRGNYFASANIYLFSNCFVAVLGCSYFSGGLYSPVTPWFSTGPVTAILLLGLNRNTVIWAVLSSACVMGFAVADGLGMSLPVMYDTRYAGFFFASSLLGLVLTFLIHTKIFEAAKNSALADTRRSNTELRQAHERTESAYQAKSRFLAAASHDLRQPAHALGMFVTRLTQLPKDQPNHELIAGVDASVRALQEMLEVFFDYSRLEAHAQEVKSVPVSIDSLFAQMRTAFTPLAQERGLQFRVRASDEWVLSDPLLLQRILLNLISNALQYTVRGGVLVACRVDRQAGQVRIQVWDSGVGIAAANHKAIFEEFFQVENPERDRQKGLGLGLSMVDKSCRILNHPLALRSVPGCGSRFTVTVPLAVKQVIAPRSRLVPAVAIPPNLIGFRILLIEDDVLGRSALTGLLESWGCSVVAFRDSQGAMAWLAQGTWPDFIVSDYRLSGELNGIETIRAIHQLTDQPTAACLISGDTDAHVREQAVAAGLVLLSKPVKPAKLRSMLRQSFLP